MKNFSKGTKVGMAIVLVVLIIVLLLIVLGMPVPKWIILVFFAGMVICFVSALIAKNRQ